MKSALSVDIAAPPAVVFALARDVTRWADLLPHYVLSRRIRRQPNGGLVVQFVARRTVRWLPGMGLPVAWRALTWSEADGSRLRFMHQGGATAGMNVTWRIEPQEGARATRVTIEHDFPAPLPWARFVDRFFTRPIATQTLATFRALAEAVDAAGNAPTTNHPT